MRSTSCGQLHSRSALTRPRSPISARPAGVGRERCRARRRPRRRRRVSTSRPVSPSSTTAPHAGIVGGDRRQAACHRLDQDDPERLRRLGREQEEVGGAQDRRELGVGDGAEEVDALGRRRPPARARGSRRAARRRRRTTRCTSPVARALASASIATSRRLKWWARSSVATKAATTASARDSQARAQAPRPRPGQKQVGIDAVRHLDQLVGVALGRSARR